MRAFVDQHRETFGVEPLCKVLQVAPSGYRRYAAQSGGIQRYAVPGRSAMRP